MKLLVNCGDEPAAYLLLGDVDFVSLLLFLVLADALGGEKRIEAFITADLAHAAVLIVHRELLLELALQLADLVHEFGHACLGLHDLVLERSNALLAQGHLLEQGRRFRRGIIELGFEILLGERILGHPTKERRAFLAARAGRTRIPLVFVLLQRPQERCHLALTMSLIAAATTKSAEMTLFWCVTDFIFCFRN